VNNETLAEEDAASTTDPIESFRLRRHPPTVVCIRPRHTVFIPSLTKTETGRYPLSL